MTGYWVVQGTPLNNTEAAKKYAELWKPIGEKFEATIQAGPDDHVCKEGNDSPRVFIVSFPTYAQAVACYESAEYQAALAYATRAYRRSFFILQGKR